VPRGGGSFSYYREEWEYREMKFDGDTMYLFCSYRSSDEKKSFGDFITFKRTVSLGGK
jgi:hypothetical protein